MLAALLFLHQLGQRGQPGTVQHVRKLDSRGGDRELVLLPFYYDDSEVGRYLTQVNLTNKILVNTAYEQFHLKRAHRFVMPDGEFARHCMLHCAWGPRFVEMLQNWGIPEARIRVTGHPRFDIYNHRSLLNTRAELAQEFELDAGKEWVLVPYNFNLAYISDVRIQRLNARGYDVGRDLIDATVQARDAFTTMVKSMAGAFPEKEIILRVHPAGYEASTIYAGAAEEFRNLHIIASYDIANWIVQSALVIVWTSTSGLEAMVAEVPVVSFEPHPFSERWDYDLNRILPTRRSADDILDLVSKLPNPELEYDWELFRQWHAHSDGNNVSRQVALGVEAAERWSELYVPGKVPRPPKLEQAKKTAKKVARAKLGGLVPKLVKPLKEHPEPEANALARAARDLDTSALREFLQ